MAGPGRDTGTTSLESVRVLAENLHHKGVHLLVLCGWRNEADQHKAFLAGNSKLDWPNGPHNRIIEQQGKMVPASSAVDIAPYPYDNGKDSNRVYRIAGYAIFLAGNMNVKLRVGADWDGDFETLDQKLQDPWHYELILP